MSTAILRSHDPVLAARLRRHALERTRELASDARIGAIALGGSVAAGPVNAGSDVDLHVFVDGAASLPVPAWRFCPDRTLENVHQWSEATVSEGLGRVGDRQALARWFYRTTFGDFLHRFEHLYMRDADTPAWQQIPMLVQQRQRPSVIGHLVDCYVNAAGTLTTEAEEAFGQSAVEDGHHRLRSAVQLTVVACLVRLGWIIRGSKNRPETADEYAADPQVRQAAVLLDETMGLSGWTPARVHELCSQRLSFRFELVDELRRHLEALPTSAPARHAVAVELEVHHEHNHLAFDYYRPLVDHGLTKGVVNHIRALSGFAHTPARLAPCWGLDSRFPVRSFLACDAISDELRTRWLHISGLGLTPGQAAQWTRRLRVLAHSLLPRHS